MESILLEFKEKFINHTLTVDDFDNEINKLKNQYSENELDEKYSVDLELELENGEIKLASPKKTCTCGNIPKTELIIKEELRLREIMKKLMDTFEYETKRLDSKLQNECAFIKRKYQMILEKRLLEERARYERAADRLHEQLDAIKTDRDDLVLSFEEEKKNIQEFYLKRIKEDRINMRDEQQQKISKGLAENNWKKTTI